jgi:hypothetical protein
MKDVLDGLVDGRGERMMTVVAGGVTVGVTDASKRLV